MKTITDPTIYVADLAAYNAGHLHGVHINLVDNGRDQVYEKIEAMLAEGTKLYAKHTLSAQHEEFAIHDYEGFGPISVSEYASIDSLLGHVERMGDDPAKYFAYIQAEGDSAAEEFDADMILGPYANPEDFAWEMLDDVLGKLTLTEDLELRGIPSNLAACMKFDAEDYMFSGRCNGDFDIGKYDDNYYVILK